MRKKDTQFEHKCDLLTEDDVFMKKYPGDTLKNKFCRAFRRYTTICFSNPRARRLFKSTHKLEWEQKRHVKFHINIIHPFSLFRVHWEILMMFIYPLAMISICFCSIYIFSHPRSTLVPNYRHAQLEMIHCFICAADMIVHFFTGYVDIKKKEVVLIPGKIVFHYIRTHFIFDFFSSIPLDHLLPVFKLHCANCHWFALARFSKFARLYTTEKYIYRFSEIIRVHPIVPEFAWLIVRLGLIQCLLSAVHFITAVDQISRSDNSWIQVQSIYRGLFVESYFRATINMFLAGNGIFYPETLDDQMLLIIAVLVGHLFVVLFVGKCLQWWNILKSSSSKYEEVTRNLKNYIRSKQLPPALKSRLIEYYEYRYQQSFFKEAEILKTLSSQLRHEVILYTCRNLLENVSFFNQLPQGLLLRIIVCLRGDTYMANDVILKAGAWPEAMFFIACGTVAIYTKTGIEVVHLEDGAHFGEIELVMKGMRNVASVVAIEGCELFRLDKRDFDRAVGPYPDLVARIRVLAEQRLEQMSEMDNKHQEHMRAHTKHHRDTMDTQSSSKAKKRKS